LKKKISKLDLDDSIEAKAQKQKLEEELADITEREEELKNKRVKDLRKKNLQDDLNNKREKINNEKETANEQYIIEKQKLDDIQKEWDRHYENLLNDERNFSSIREDVMNGHFENIMSDFENFEKFMGEHTETIGESISQNIIDKLKDVNKQIKNVQSGNISPSDNGSVISKMKANSAEWHSSSDSRKSELEAENKRLGKSIGATYNSEKGAWYKNDKRLYHKGGIVGNSSSKIGDIVDRLFNTKPNEKVVKSLKGELQAPPKNIANNFIPNMRSLISPAIPMQRSASTGGNVYNIDINIDKLAGGEKGAGDLFKHINRKMKRFGGDSL
ncbi:MAG: hypothetical protein WD512_03075, partial [Candidatus Paceibacterota bacterium]